MPTLEETQKQPTRSRVKFRFTRLLAQTLRYVLEVIATLLYREMMKRNTLDPMRRIIDSPSNEAKRSVLRDWAHTKANEATYIQVAGGFIFTSVVSCLQWPSTVNGHWSASALFYSSILFALVAVVMASQQMLLLPGERHASREKARADGQLTEVERIQLDHIVARVCVHRREAYPNSLHIYALQAPLMLLSLSVVSFFGGMAAVVFAPLARNLQWDGNAKIATLVGSVGLVITLVFAFTSMMMHGLFSLQEVPPSRIGSFLVRIKA